jgi:hypothetical protein
MCGKWRSRGTRATECPGLQMRHPVSGGYKLGDLVLQVGGWANKPTPEKPYIKKPEVPDGGAE